MAYPRHAMLARFYTQFDLPGTTRLMDWLGIRNDELWSDAPCRIVRGKWDKCHRRVDLRNWSERLTFFLRRYYEMPPQLMLIEAVRQGDTVVDIGSNVGMITTLVAHLVGPSGRVEAFEPNPDCCRRIEGVLETNGLKHVHLHHCALADENGELDLTVAYDHTGYGTLAQVNEGERREGCRRVKVQVLTGDEVLGKELDELAAIKIDVEGYESYVVRGLHDTLAKWKPMVIAEVSEEWLRRAGSSSEDLFGLMRGHGYSAYALRVYKPGVFSRPRLALRHVEGAGNLNGRESNVVWVDQSGPMMQRVKHLVFG